MEESENKPEQATPQPEVDQPKVEPLQKPKPKSEVEQIMKGIPKAEKVTPVDTGEKEVKKKKQSKFITFLLDLGLNLLIVFGLVFVIQTFLASPFKVFGPSMCDTLNYINEECEKGYGEYIIVNKLVYKNFFGWSLADPDRGDIVVFHPPHTDKDFFIKRVIGIPGDTIKLIDGKVFLFNDEYETGYELPEDYLNDENADNTIPSTNRVTTFEVPEDHFFLLGDNRGHSTDSRSCFRDAFQGGCRGEESHFLPKENIEGRAWVVLWPFNKIRLIPKADYFE
jgi:signal peptidase I